MEYTARFSDKLNHEQIFTLNNLQYQSVLKYLNEVIVNSKTYLPTIYLKEVIEEYCLAKHIQKPDIIRRFSIFRRIFGKNSLELNIQEFTPDMFQVINDLNVSSNTKLYYLTIIRTIFDYCVKKEYLISNPCPNNLILFKNEINHSKAFNCNLWLGLNDVKKDLIPFFKTFTFDNLDIFLFLHIILGLRITETIRVVKNFTSQDKENKFILIKTKTFKNFRVVLSDLAIHLIEKIKYAYFSLSDSRLRLLIRTSLNKKSSEISLHGFRSILRTIIEFLPETKQISYEAKEFYLSHKILNKVVESYQRYDYFNERMTIQKKYAEFLLTCLNESELKKEFQKVLEV